MRHISSRRRAENEPFAPDSRPDAASFVYCVGCGKALGQRSGLLRGRGAAINIYCPKCQGRDAEAWGEDAPQTYCFRCGTKHIRYIEIEPYRTLHSICPRCRPERAARYAAGDFAPLPPAEETEGDAQAETKPAEVATTPATAKPSRKSAAVEEGPAPTKTVRKAAPTDEAPATAKPSRKSAAVEDGPTVTKTSAKAAMIDEVPTAAKSSRKSKAAKESASKSKQSSTAAAKG